MRGQTIYKAAAISTKIGRRNFKLTLSVLMFLFVYSLTGCCVVWGGGWGLGAINLKSYINIVGKLRSWWLVIREPCPLRRPPWKVPTKILLLLVLCLLWSLSLFIVTAETFYFWKVFYFLRRSLIFWAVWLIHDICYTVCLAFSANFINLFVRYYSFKWTKYFWIFFSNLVIFVICRFLKNTLSLLNLTCVYQQVREIRSFFKQKKYLVKNNKTRDAVTYR